MLNVLEEINVKKIIIGKQGDSKEQYDKLLEISKKKMIPIIVVEKGDIINIERDLKIRILFPINELIEENVLNNNSIVAKLEYKKFSML
ncbi:MAG: hypothetical protein Q4E31_12905, partial [Intestinibacter bartlettii]|uniref:hypothetical protein n=1 Tax=Intestinibacter bartlettii TaxID=261299 RepID=UPI0026EFBF08